MNDTLENQIESIKLNPTDLIPGYGFIRYFKRNSNLPKYSFIDFLDVSKEQATYEDCRIAIDKDRKYFKERLSTALLLTIYNQMTLIPAINAITEKLF